MVHAEMEELAGASPVVDIVAFVNLGTVELTVELVSYLYSIL